MTIPRFLARTDAKGKPGAAGTPVQNAIIHFNVIPMKNPSDKEFPVISLRRADLRQIGYDTSKVSDATMQRMALKLAEQSLTRAFSDNLDSVAEELKIQKGRKRQNDESTEAVLGQAHEEEIILNDAEAWNLGWYSGITRIESKTDKGILISVIDRKSKRVSHRWDRSKC